MDVILLEKIGKLGNLGDKVTVKAGYGRNYLIPFGKAVAATKDNVAVYEAKRAELEKVAAEKLALAQTRAEKLADISVSIAANAGEEGKLFGSIGTRDIEDAVKAQGHDVSKSEIRLPNGPLREIGEYDIAVQLHTDVNCVFKLTVVAE